jgi:hypothetical protein
LALAPKIKINLSQVALPQRWYLYTTSADAAARASRLNKEFLWRVAPRNGEGNQPLVHILRLRCGYSPPAVCWASVQGLAAAWLADMDALALPNLTLTLYFYQRL